MRLSPWWLIALTVATATLIGVVVFHSVAPDESAACENALSSSKQGLIAQSEKQYAAILADDPDDQCALAGLKVVATKLCRQAGRLLWMKEPDEAKKAYLALLTKYPWKASGICARKGLSKVRAQKKVQQTNEKEKGKEEDNS